jgi:DNA-binding NtrC family response regulator
MANILVIDDSQSVLALMERILAGAGHQVTACLSAKQAMKLAAVTPVDLIITDLYMPDKDGLEVIAEARKVCPKVPVLAVSSVGGAKNMLHTAKHLGAANTLEKPFSKEQLLQAVAAAMATAGVHH